MKKSSLFFLALSVAILIAYIKRPPLPNQIASAPKLEEKWKTFEKKSNEQIITHTSTDAELAKGNITRKIASTNKTEVNLFSLREDRILTGENVEKYKDESIELNMLNRVNPEWKELLGNELLRFQKDDTKIIIKDELHLIKILDGKGQYLEQVVVTYFLKNGDQNSFRALINSETGTIIDTWDRTIHERLKRRPQQLIPSGTSNIIGR